MKDNEKQAIEEFENDLVACHTEFADGNGDIYTDYSTTAEKMVAKGYRKQIEGEWATETTDWVYDVKRTYCSNCGKSAIFDSFMGKYRLTNFCPNCGASMKGGAE